MKWYKVKDASPNLHLIGLKRDELYFSIESVGLTVADVLAMVVEVGGDILVGVNNGLSGVLVSESAIGGGLIVQGSKDFDNYVRVVKEIKQKLKEKEKE